MDDLKFNVHTELHDAEIAGGDGLVARVPDGFYVTMDGEKALDLRRVGPALRTLAMEQAANLGEDLHHAEFVLTTDPATVESHGNMHPGCPECEAGVRAALRALRANPEQEFLVGQLFWAKT